MKKRTKRIFISLLCLAAAAACFWIEGSSEIDLRYGVQETGPVQTSLPVRVTGTVLYNRLRVGDASFSGEIEIGTRCFMIDGMSLAYPTKDRPTWEFFLFSSQQEKGGKIASEIVGDDFVGGEIDPITGNISLFYTKNHESYAINLILLAGTRS